MSRQLDDPLWQPLVDEIDAWEVPWSAQQSNRLRELLARVSAEVQTWPEPWTPAQAARAEGFVEAVDVATSRNKLAVERAARMPKMSSIGTREPAVSTSTPEVPASGASTADRVERGRMPAGEPSLGAAAETAVPTTNARSDVGASVREVVSGTAPQAPSASERQVPQRLRSFGLQPGTQLAGYVIQKLIGDGGTSRVYKAEQLSLGREVALKILAPELAADSAYRERFLHESRLAAALDHPNILPVYDAGEDAGYLYIATRFVAGTDLGAVVAREGALDPERALSYLAQAAAALDAAHAKGLVHRDVKPANLLIAGEQLYLTDFGVAKSAQDSSGLTRVGMFVGTIDYAPPEQIRGEPLDGRADLYALACVFYQCLTGQVPFDRPSDHAILQAHLTEPPPLVHWLRADLPTGLDAVLARAMAKDKNQRYQSGHIFAETARAALAAGGAASLPQRLTVIREASASKSLAAPLAARANVVPEDAALTTRTSFGRRLGIQALVVGTVAILLVGGGLVLASGQSLPWLISDHVAVTSPPSQPSPAAILIPSPAPTRTPSPSLTPARTASPTPVPTPHRVTLRPDQVIMPPAEFPLPGWTVSTDKAGDYVGGLGWERDFMAPSSSAYVFALVDVVALAPETDPSARFAAYKCGSNDKFSEQEVSADRTGDASMMCQLHLLSSPQFPSFQYAVLSRNTIVLVIVMGQSWASETAVLDQTVAIARKQIEIIDRVAPR